MANVQPVNPHQAEIDALVNRILPRVLAMPFSKNPKEPWLGNAAVNKAVLATITTLFILADEDAAANAAFLATQVQEEEPQPELDFGDSEPPQPGTILAEQAHDAEKTNPGVALEPPTIPPPLGGIADDPGPDIDQG